MVGLFLQELAFDRFSLLIGPGNSLRDLRIAFVHCLLSGYLPAAYLYLMQATRQTITTLTPLLDKQSNAASALNPLSVRDRTALLAGLIGIFFTFLTTLLTASTPWDISTWTLESGWHRILGPWIGWWFGWISLGISRTSRQVAHLTTRIKKVNLLDLSPLDPFVKHGLLTALLIVGAVSIGSLFLFDPGSGMWLVVASVVGISLPLALLGLFMPVRGVYLQIHAAKQVETAWIREQIQQARDSLRDTSGQRPPGSLADLLAYQNFIEEVPEWPLQSLSIVQVFVYLLIPVLSWVGGLLIENVLGFFFG